ncbi:MAG: ABC transporter substrate-binding protein [Spirochaetes bacterium]|nr:ABC transporter substrate-binding protein [Spirochaetota bacterium]
MIRKNREHEARVRRKRRTRTFLVRALAAAVIFPAAAYAADDVKIAMGYIPNVQFAPYYVAEEMGYFEEEGIEVTFDYGMATDILSLAASGAVEFGVSDGDQVIVAREKGVPVKVVYTMYVKYPVGVVSLEKSGIADIRGLEGKRVGTPVPYGSNYFGLLVLLKNAGMTLDDIDLRFIGYTQTESLLSKKVDASVVFVNNEPVVMRDNGYRVRVIEAYRVTPMVSAAIIAGERLIKSDPGLVKRFVRAVSRASRYTLENPDRALLLMRRHIQTLTEANMEINRKVLLSSMKLWVDEDIETHGLGYTSKSDWERSIETMRALGLIEKDIDPEACYTNEFIIPPR